MDWKHFNFFNALFIVYCFNCVNAAEYTITPNYDDIPEKSNSKIIRFKEFNKFFCDVKVEKGDNEEMPKFSIKWKKDGPEGRDNDVVIDNRHVKLENNVLHIYASRQEDMTNYSCEILDEHKKYKAHRTFYTFGKPFVKLQVLINPVDEGDTIKVECDILGTSSNTIWMKDGQVITRGDSERHNISDNIQKGVAAYSLTIENAELSDRGEYLCIADGNYYGNATGKVMVRVKDRFAALWPFIGICAEVLVLCTVIFIYERKRNKSEMDESDTDQSPEQKNTPDHGKETTRQRK